MPPKVSANEREEAAYIARMCREMRDLAGGSRLGFLAYLLDMARIEAEAHAAGEASPPSAAKRADGHSRRR